MKKIIIIFLFALISLFSFNNYSSAQINSGLLDKMTGNSQLLNKSVNPGAGSLTGSEMDRYVGGIIGMILSFAGVIFLVLIIIAGYLWITAQGAEDKITKAKQLLTNGIIGAVISFGAFIIINAVISPLYEKFYSPSEISSTGDGGEQTIIPCEDDVQCADQLTRKLCIAGNCLECNTNSDCQYDAEKNTCDVQNHVCVVSPTADCASLSLKTCLSQTNRCRVDYYTEEYTENRCVTVKTSSVRGIDLSWCDQFKAEPSCNENQLWCKWETFTKTKTSSNCVNKSDYKCTTQCTSDKPLCNSAISTPKCVECLSDNDCVGNLLDKKCSVSTGNYICVPF